MGLLHNNEMEHKYLRRMWKEEYSPKLLPKMKLHPWQKLGVTFLHNCCEKFGFAILGDEMGVGKVVHFTTLTDGQTIQTLSFIYGRIEQALREPEPVRFVRRINIVIW